MEMEMEMDHQTKINKVDPKLKYSKMYLLCSGHKLSHSHPYLTFVVLAWGYVSSYL